MPRTFRYEHFTAQKPNVSRTLKNKEKQRVSMAEEKEKMEEMTEAGLHYGKRHAETEELAQVKAAAHESVSPGTAAQQENAGRAAPVEELISAQSEKAPAQASVQIPADDATMPRGMLQVLDDGRKELEVMSRSMIELGRAGVRLVQLSYELTWLATRSILSARRQDDSRR